MFFFDWNHLAQWRALVKNLREIYDEREFLYQQKNYKTPKENAA
jgi:hypothetical protein